MDYSFDSKLEPKKGLLLISEPFLDDDYFRRSVILVCEHNEEGTYGFVLNNFIDIQLDELIDNFPIVDTKISIGGPVETKNIFFIHSLGDIIEGSIKIADEIFIGGEFEDVVNLIKENPAVINKVRFFLGYAGWSVGQLEEEMDIKSWIVSPIKSIRDIFQVDDKDVWKKYLEDLGGKYRVMSNFPIDPKNN
jgi:putative transcriptional regulator